MIDVADTRAGAVGALEAWEAGLRGCAAGTEWIRALVPAAISEALAAVRAEMVDLVRGTVGVAIPLTGNRRNSANAVEAVEV